VGWVNIIGKTESCWTTARRNGKNKWRKIRKREQNEQRSGSNLYLHWHFL